VLAKGLAIDLDPVAFSEGSAAVTALSHLSVQIWQTDASPTYLLSVPRTVVGHVWDWLLSSAAEFGYAAERRPSLHR
jgi:sarcosine oxidase subunit gamma